jgi:hypothetical protein
MALALEDSDFDSTGAGTVVDVGVATLTGAGSDDAFEPFEEWVAAGTET